MELRVGKHKVDRLRVRGAQSLQFTALGNHKPKILTLLNPETPKPSLSVSLSLRYAEPLNPKPLNQKLQNPSPKP